MYAVGKTSVLHSSKNSCTYWHLSPVCARRDNGHNEILVPVDKAGVDQIISYYPCRAALVTVISKTAGNTGGALDDH